MSLHKRTGVFIDKLKPRESSWMIWRPGSLHRQAEAQGVFIEELVAREFGRPGSLDRRAGMPGSLHKQGEVQGVFIGKLKDQGFFIGELKDQGSKGQESLYR